MSRCCGMRTTRLWTGMRSQNTPWPNLGQWIRHTHLKDSVQVGKERKYVLPGTGDVPMERQIMALRNIGYKGYYCFEWEKVWHPDILEPEVAFPDYVKLVTGYLTEPLNARGNRMRNVDS